MTALRFPPPKPTRRQLEAAHAAQRPPSPVEVADMAPIELFELAVRGVEAAHAAALAGSVDPKRVTFTEISDATGTARRALRHLRRADGLPEACLCRAFHTVLTPTELERARGIWRCLARLEAALAGRDELRRLTAEARAELEELVHGLGHGRSDG